MKAPDAVGQTFGRLTITGLSHVNRERYWVVKCRCTCGNDHTVRFVALRSGNTKSCGCLQREAAGAIAKDWLTTHGKCRTHEYRAWARMKSRCSNPNLPGYKYWGGRGIRVCRRWRNSFVNFLADMGRCPTGRSLDRIDNEKGYSPSNCRWATPVEQAQNRRTVLRITAFGRTQALQHWAEEFRIKQPTLRARLKSGWPIEAALTHPVRPVSAGRRSKHFQSRSCSARARARRHSPQRRTHQPQPPQASG